jgi:hypothetical protein
MENFESFYTLSTLVKQLLIVNRIITRLLLVVMRRRAFQVACSSYTRLGKSKMDGRVPQLLENRYTTVVMTLFRKAIPERTHRQSRVSPYGLMGQRGATWVVVFDNRYTIIHLDGSGVPVEARVSLVLPSCITHIYRTRPR